MCIFKEDNCNFPINTSNTYLRGGSNLVHYKDGYYIGGCHSRILKNREYDDIIIIDDCRQLGNTGSCGCDNEYYPNIVYNWVDITEQKIIEKLKPGYILLKNTDFERNYDEYYGFDYEDGWDQFFCVKSK